jgi:predicted membrane chloride channel (bestrophin family)
MIHYYKGAFGVNLLWRFRGSAVYRAFFPGLFSAFIFLLIRLQWQKVDPDRELRHPYAVGVLVGTVSFLVIFRANNGYARYWEATGAVFNMMSKFMDATIHTAVYHLQCDHYKDIKPPSYFNYPELNKDFLTRYRERTYNVRDPTILSERATRKSIEIVDKKAVKEPFDSSSLDSGVRASARGKPTLLRGKPRLDGGWIELFPPDPATGRKTSTFYDPNLPWNADGKGFASTIGGRTPALFLQELAHLSSLVCAVALSTLRNDIEGAESPLDVYKPGEPWPEADPDMIPDAKVGWSEAAKYLTGRDRSPEDRTKYNASRPLSVLGGVSDAEIRFIQMARGPLAKTQLCWSWLSELIMREHLSGALGKIGPPIISRVAQFLGDGMLYYNQARKIMYVPFPFPTAQIAAFFIIVMTFTVPLLSEQYVSDTWLGALLTFLIVACLAGLHEVARELENPFRNVPNDLPLCTFQAFYNEALLIMFSGYHPDAYWSPENQNQGRKSSTTSVIPEGESESDETLGDLKASLKGKTLDENELGVSMAQLVSRLEAQGKEIERLKDLVEGRAARDGN